MADSRQRRAAYGSASIAVGLMLCAYALFSVTDTSTKLLLASGFTALQLAFGRYAVQFLITILDMMRKRGLVPSVEPRIWAVLFLRAGLLVGSTIINFIALRFLPLTVTSAIMFSSPIFVCLLSGPLLGERVGVVRWAFVAIGFLGVLVVIRPFGTEIEWAAVMMLLPALGLALYSILTRKLANDVDATTMQFALGLLGSVALAPFAYWFWRTPSTAMEWVLTLALGASAWAGHELLIRAHKQAEANFLMPFSYSYILFMTLASLLAFGHAPDLPTLIGAVLITLSGLLIWRHGRPA